MRVFLGYAWCTGVFAHDRCDWIGCEVRKSGVAQLDWSRLRPMGYDENKKNSLGFFLVE